MGIAIHPLNNWGQDGKGRRGALVTSLSVPSFFLFLVEHVDARFVAPSFCRSSAGKQLFHPGSAKSDCPKYLKKKSIFICCSGAHALSKLK